jgi:low temperature requirement protein LtrA
MMTLLRIILVGETMLMTIFSLLNIEGGVGMYIAVFTGFLVVILVWKFIKLLKNKKKSGDFENIDDTLITLLNEGDQIG